MTSVNTNSVAYAAIAKLNSSANEISEVVQRLSSGLRVNSAKDDEAALAVSTTLVSNVLGLSRAYKNVSDAVSLSETANGALKSVSNTLIRMKELALSSANGSIKCK